MTGAARNPENEADTFRLGLERLLAAHTGGRRIETCTRRESAFASSHRLIDIGAVLDDGSVLQLVGKGCGPCGLLDDTRRTRPPFMQQQMREADLYNSVLRAAGSSVVTGYGVLSIPDSELKYLILERVDGLELRRIGDFDTWGQAAYQLALNQARLAQHLASLPPGQRPDLVQYSPAFFRTWLERAIEPGLGADGWPAEARQAMRQVAARYDTIIDHLRSLAPTVIHGDCFASNILVAGEGSPRLAFVDWEMAGFGPGLVDLAALTSGDWTAREREALLASYRDGLIATGRHMPSLDEMLYSLDACRMHLAIQMLGWSANWVPPSEQRQDWLGEALRTAEQLGLRGAS